MGERAFCKVKIYRRDSSSKIGRNQIALIKFLLIDRQWGIDAGSGFCIQERLRKTKRLLKTKQCSANSLPLQTAASHCFNVTFRFLSLSKHTEQSPESIPQCLSIGKISVAIWFLLSRKKNSTWDGKSIVRRIVQGRYWKPIKSYTLLCFILTSTSMLLMIYSMY